MGIPFYFATLIKTHGGIVRSLKGKHQTDILCFDFNCLIHRYLDEDNPIESILKAFEMILSEYCQAKIIYVAFDGLVPYAKIVQQRYRRMCLKEVSGNFDRNQISPGTPYMLELEDAMKLRFPQIIISGTQEPGEGEHKIIQFLQHSKKNKSITIYGLDADLILICLQHHKLSLENSMFLLRESSEMGEKEEFAIMDIWKLFLQLPIDIYQYIALSIMCFGNDFMPSLGIFSLREDGYNRALQFYEKSKKPNLLTIEGRKIFLNYVALEEQKILNNLEQPIVCLVTATDGLWDNWIDSHVCKFVMDPSCLKAIIDRPEDGAQRVAKSLMMRNDMFAKKNFGSSRDNATCLVTYITRTK
jgi:5'-3' exonuclease